MIKGYGIILQDKILYCSDENFYTVFEILLFIERLIRNVNPKQTWRLNNICFYNDDGQEFRMIIKHLITDSRQNLFYCVFGTFSYESMIKYNVLEDYYDKINEYYQSVDVLKAASKKVIFREIIKIIIEYLEEKYEKLLDKEEIKGKMEELKTNKILFCGISSQGLPIISDLYEKNLLDYIDRELNEDNIELFNSNLSAQLATIEMNTIIRAKLKIKEIHIDDFGSQDPKKTFLFSDLFNYSLHVFASGNFSIIREVVEQLKSEISKESVLQDDFSGDLKPYKHLREYINEFVKIFDNNK